MHRFFCGREQINDNKIRIIGQDAKHIEKVLRLKIGDEIEIICDGINYTLIIKSFDNMEVNGDITNKFVSDSEAKIQVKLFQGLVKGNKWDFLLQKGTEIGISDFYPVQMKRSVTKIEEKKMSSKIDRFQTIVKEAAKQSKRSIIPKVHNVMSFNEMLAQLELEEFIVVPYEEENTYIKTVLKDIKQSGTNSISIIIGPEGGFEAEEIDRIKDVGGKPVSLGKRILRTETAGMLTAALAIYEVTN